MRIRPVRRSTAVQVIDQQRQQQHLILGFYFLPNDAEMCVCCCRLCHNLTATACGFSFSLSLCLSVSALLLRFRRNAKLEEKLRRQKSKLLISRSRASCFHLLQARARHGQRQREREREQAFLRFGNFHFAVERTVEIPPRLGKTIAGNNMIVVIMSVIIYYCNQK